MKSKPFSTAGGLIVCAAVLLSLFAGSAAATIDGIMSPTSTFSLTAKVDNISTVDGGSPLLWGYADTSANPDNRAQYPGPTLIVNEGDTVTVQLTNALSVAGTGPVPNVSIVFPGQQVTATGGVSGLLTREAQTADIPGTPEDESLVTYSFIATNPGTYMYHSGTRPELQVEMGLLGALIIRPALGANFAYNDLGTAFDREYLFLLSEMDPRIHEKVAFFGPDSVQLTGSDYLSDYFSNYWFINGRVAPDNMDLAGTDLLPTQPYNIMPRMHPGERLLMRVIGGNRDMHPFHHHGNHARIIARDGRLLRSPTGGTDLSYEVFTINSVPGETVDAIFTWTGKGLNWDIYGTLVEGPDYEHECNGIALSACESADPNDNNPDCQSATPEFDPVTNEYCGDHGKPFPTQLPQNQDLAFGGWYSGSQFLGGAGSLPPGEGGLNPNGGFSYMWHSHTEKELTNYDIFPGGMLTMLIIERFDAPIP